MAMVMAMMRMVKVVGLKVEGEKTGSNFFSKVTKQVLWDEVCSPFRVQTYFIR